MSFQIVEFVLRYREEFERVLAVVRSSREVHPAFLPRVVESDVVRREHCDEMWEVDLGLGFGGERDGNTTGETGNGGRANRSCRLETRRLLS